MKKDNKHMFLKDGEQFFFLPLGIIAAARNAWPLLTFHEYATHIITYLKLLCMFCYARQKLTINCT